MKRLLSLSLFLMALTIQVIAQTLVVPDFSDVDPSQFGVPGGGSFNLLEVDPSVLPTQNPLYEEVTSVASGDWNDPMIWDCECVPNSSNSVTISTDDAVTFTEDKEIYTLHVMIDGILEAVSETPVRLTLFRDVAAYGTLDLANSDLRLAGIDSQQILGTVNAEKLYLAGNNDVTVEGNLLIADEIWIGNTTLITNDRLFLTSKEDQMGQIAPIFTGEIIGNAHMSVNFSTTKAGWMPLCSPVYDETVATFVDDFITTGFPGSAAPDYPSASNRFNSVNYYVEESNDASTDYSGAIDSNDELLVGRGYYVFTIPNDYAYDVTGEPITGEVNIPVNYTNNDTPSVDGLNLVANPYAATINWDSQSGWEKENMVGAVYVWDVSQNQYRSYINGLGINGGSAFLEPMRAFWVMANAENPTLTINEAAKSLHDAQTKTESKNMTIQIAGTSGTDQLIITTSEGSTLAFDAQYDALKFDGAGVVPNISMLSTDDIELGINSIPEVTEAQQLEMLLNIREAGDYTLTFDGVSEYLQNQCVAIEDLTTSEIYDLGVTTEITFSSEIVEDEKRFVLHIGGSVTAESTSAVCHGDLSGSILTEGTGAGPWDYKWYDSEMTLLGETLGESEAFTIMDLAAGDYHVQVGNNDYCAALTVDVSIEQPSEPITVTEWVFNIDCDEEDTGEVTLAIAGGVAPYQIDWDNEMTGSSLEGLSAGDYTYVLTDDAGCIKEQTLMIVQAPNVEVNFSVDQPVITLDENSEAEVVFMNNSEGTTDYEWDFGDSSDVSTEESPTHTYTEPGFYTVSMYATNGECDDYYQAVVVVEENMDTGIEEMEFADAINIQYMTNEVTISSKASGKQQVSVEVYDLLGKVISSDKGLIGAGATLRLGINSASAMYLVSVINKGTGEKTTKKISRF